MSNLYYYLWTDQLCPVCHSQAMTILSVRRSFAVTMPHAGSDEVRTIEYCNKCEFMHCDCKKKICKPKRTEIISTITLATLSGAYYRIDPYVRIYEDYMKPTSPLRYVNSYCNKCLGPFKIFGHPLVNGLTLGFCVSEKCNYTDVVSPAGKRDRTLTSSWPREEIIAAYALLVLTI